MHRKYGVAWLSTVAILAWMGAPSGAGAQGSLKVFISVDMEGLAGVVTSSDVSQTGRDYEHFRKIMAGETNAAIEGAFAAGATEVVVRDSHGAKQNLLPGDVDRRARLLRGATTAPKNMMEGIDASFGAAVFVGYHARAGTPDAILAHTSNGNVIDFSINGTSLPEAGYNALVAGLYDVPVVFASGDRAFVEQAKTLLGSIETVAVKEAIGGGGVLGLSPDEARDRIRSGVEGGVRNRGRVKPFRMTPPYSMVLKVRNDKTLIAGATRPRPGESLFSSADLLEVLAAFNSLK
ncbi:MAG TPA: M55 family metallopeptidase [Vicinamibacterales bacterium]|nr:M55 family metallopeptidase [Vicinamibacterales bacterium]